MIRIHGIPGSPYVRIVLLTCLEKGAPHQLVPVAPGQHRAPEHLARHPFGRVPAIDDDGFVLYETQAITRYIDASQPGPALKPADPKGTAVMDQVIGVIDWYFFAPNSAMTLGFNRVVAPRLGIPVNEEAVKASLPDTQRCVDVFAGYFADGRPYVAGDQLTLADLHAGPHLEMLSESPEGAAMLQGTPISAWLDRLAARPSFASTTWDSLLKAA
jgi:glutathione S-transferase